MPGIGRRMSPLLLLVLIGVCLPAIHWQAAPAAAADMLSPALAVTPQYTIAVGEDPTGPVEVELLVSAPVASLDLYFPAAGSGGQRLELIAARTGDGAELAVERRGASGFRVAAHESSSVIVTYRLNLSPSLWSPSTWPGRGLTSVRADDVVWLVGRDALMEVSGAEGRPKEVRLRVPAGWQAWRGGAGLVDPRQPISIPAGEELNLLLGSFSLSRYPLPTGQLTLIVASDPPWEPGQLAWSVQAILEGLTSKGIPGPPADLTLVVLRYPGALRLNPLVGSQLAGGHTLIHWVGTGTLNWWRKHAARDVVAWHVDHTLRLAADARWLQAGLAEYGGLALLFDTGFLTVDDMYQSLRALHSNGLHYSGAAWPSLVSAALESPPSHSGERVLAFRAPLVALLMDLEIGSVSEGTASIFDLWARLAAAQQQGPAATLHTAAVLAPLADLGVPAAFTQNFIYGTRLPPADFDRLFQQWFEQNTR